MWIHFLGTQTQKEWRQTFRSVYQGRGGTVNTEIWKIEGKCMLYFLFIGKVFLCLLSPLCLSHPSSHPVCLFVCSFFSLFHPFIYASILSFHPSSHPFICQCIHPFIHLLFLCTLQFILMIIYGNNRWHSCESATLTSQSSDDSMHDITGLQH